MLNGLDLFSGIGGFALALRGIVRPIAYCEIDPYCQAVLLSSMRGNKIESAPIWDDVRNLRGTHFREGDIDIITGGFPCQDISIAGAGKGLDGKNSGLVWELIRLVREIHPPFVFMENVSAIKKRGATRITRELASAGYDCRWEFVSAAEVGAPHIRKRWFLLAYSNRIDLRIKHWRRSGAGGQEAFEFIDFGDATNPNKLDGREGRTEPEIWRRNKVFNCDCGKWEKKAEPEMGVLVDGVSPRVDELRALGNAVVPRQALEGFKRTIGLTEID